MNSDISGNRGVCNGAAPMVVVTATAATRNSADRRSESTSTSSSLARVGAYRAHITVVILCLVNLLNYMDRFTVAGVLPDVQDYYGINDADGGLLQTVFVLSYMVFAPIFGYLGDRYSRKTIIAIGVLFWSFTTLAGSFIPANHFWAFLLFRGLVGVGEASYSTIAPTIIADLYCAAERSKMLAVFYFAIPVGSGLGYIVGSNVAVAMGNWHWALRVTPVLGVICVLLVVLAMRDPVRGAIEGGELFEATSWSVDIAELLKNRSFIWSTAGFTCVAFVAGALSWWGPTFLVNSIEVQGESGTLASVSLVFGLITVVAGIVGVASGSGLSTYFKQRRISSADPLICAFGMMCSMPFLFFGAVLSKYSTVIAYILIFFGETLLCFTWAVVADILMYVVVPTRRATAAAAQILVSHAFGDAGSPYIIGAVSDAITAGRKSTLIKYHSLQYAMFITCFVNVIGAFCFLVTEWYVAGDKAEADKAIKGSRRANSVETTSSSNAVGATECVDHDNGGGSDQQITTQKIKNGTTEEIQLEEINCAMAKKSLFVDAETVMNN